MFTARALALAGLLFLARSAFAHPVSQGALEITVSKTRVLILAQVSDEEVLVENAYASKKVTRLESVKSHGTYLLNHMRLIADGEPLQGRVIASPATLTDKPVYALEFTVPEGAPPRHLRLEEDVLREFEFAPGNMWEASYIVRIGVEGKPAREGLLVSYRQPLEYDVDWEGTASGVSHGAMAKSFIGHGILHILTGYDHLLFVSALLLAVASFWDLILVISAFTLAHTLTLILSALNLVRLPSSVVEPMIAASIVFVALQNVFWPQQSRGLNRLLIAFAFGLFHGLGFAGGLLEAMSNMSGWVAALAIAAFSLGVEVGHQTVVLPLFFALRAARGKGKKAAKRDAWLRRLGSAAIALAGSFYLVAALRG